MTGRPWACAGRSPLFDADIHGESEKQKTARHGRALGICAGCTTRVECLELVDPRIDDGIRGGTNLGSIEATRKRNQYARRAQAATA